VPTTVRFSWFTAIITLAVLLIPLIQIAVPVFASTLTTTAPLVGAWNPGVSCTPTTVRITDITANQTGTSSFNANPFSPGITTTVGGGDAKRWLTPGPTTSGWHSPGPACTITNNFGKQQGVFVEIDGVKRASAVFEDSSTSYDPTNGGGSYGGPIFNDFTFNIYDPAIVSNYGTSCTTAKDLTCYGRIHLEIDHDWQAAKYCGSGTACDPNALNSQTTQGVTLIDFQGFVYWDGNNANSASHSFSGWELHPLTGWRIHQSTLNVGISFTPSSPVTGQVVTFNGTASGGTAPYTFSWTLGDGATGTGNPATHTYTASGSYSAGLSVTDSKGATGAASTTVTVTGTPPTSVIVASDAAPGPSSLATAGGEKLIQDSAGKMIAVYTDSIGRIGLAYDNSDPMLGGWSAPVKSSTPASAYVRPAAALVSLTSLELIVEGGSGAGMVSDIPVVIQRDSQNNITGFTIGTIKTLDSSGLGRYPTAVLLHNGDILAAWAWQNSTRTMVKSLRWDSSTGWTNLAGSSSTPDMALLDSVSITWFVPNMIERPDNNNVYLMANRFTGPPETIALNKATWNGSGWSWGSQNITYETNCSDADDDLVGLAWDPVRSLVVVAYGITGTLSYGVFTLTSQDLKTHLDTPSLAVTNRGWAGIAVHITTGDYYIFFMNVNTDGGSGPLGYVRSPAGGAWNPTVNYLDSATTDQVLSLRPTGTSPTIDLLYATGTSSPSTIKFTSVRPSNPSSFSVSANPTTLTTQAGSSAISTITLTSQNGFTGTVSLSTNISPSGLTASLSPSSITLTSGGTGTSTLTANSTTTGTYTVTVVATSGSAAQSVQVTVRVTDFMVSAQSSLTVTSGSATTSTITLTSFGNFSGDVDLSESVTPSTGLTVSCDPASVFLSSGSSANSTCTLTSSTPNTYTVTITASSGSLSHTATITVGVRDFTISASPTTVNVQAGSSGTSSITLRSVAGFTGTINFSIAVTPSGLTASISPASISLSPGGSGSSTLTINSTKVGTYTVIVTGTSGSSTHSVTITVNVQDFTLAVNPSSLSIASGNSGTVTVSIAGTGGFTSTVSLTAVCTPSGPRLSLSSGSVSLSSGGSGTSTLTVRTFHKTPPGTYTITITAASGSLTHTITVVLTVT